MNDVQCYELFGGIALKNHAFSFLTIKIKNDDKMQTKQANHLTIHPMWSDTLRKKHSSIHLGDFNTKRIQR